MFITPYFGGCKYTNKFLFINKNIVFQHFDLLITLSPRASQHISERRYCKNYRPWKNMGFFRFIKQKRTKLPHLNDLAQSTRSIRTFGARQFRRLCWNDWTEASIYIGNNQPARRAHRECSPQPVWAVAGGDRIFRQRCRLQRDAYMPDYLQVSELWAGYAHSSAKCNF